MRVLLRSLPAVLLSLGILVYVVMHDRRLVVAAVALTDRSSTSAPAYVYAGIPFVIHDGYATQLCISSRFGRPLLPFVVSASAGSSGLSAAPAHVQAGVPFVVRDGWSTQLCVSTQGGEPLVPFIVP